MTAETMVQPVAGFADETVRIELIRNVLGQHRCDNSPLARIIGPLMVALDWFGAPRSLMHSLPEADMPITQDDLIRMLRDQGFMVEKVSWSKWCSRHSNSIDALPSGSIVLGDNSARVYLGRRDEQHWWHDGEQLQSMQPPTVDDRLLLISSDPQFQPIDAPQSGWLNRLFFRARKEFVGLISISLMANLLALVISLFTMFVYNTIIPSGSVNTLWAMGAGAIIAIIGAWLIRLARVQLVSNMSAWAGLKVSNVAMRKTLGLSSEVSSRLGVENNLVRMRSIEGVRQWFGGAGNVVNTDYPFIVIFILVIALIGGWIALVPLFGMALYLLFSIPLSRLIQARSSEVSRVNNRLNEMTSVLTHRLRALRGVRASRLWNGHLNDLLSQSVIANREFTLANGLAQTIGQGLSMMIVLATMGVGILLVLDGAMSTGGLIASMMLIWRVTTPAQQMFANQLRYRQLKSATQQHDRLMQSSGETSRPQMVSPVHQLTAGVEVGRLFYRYNNDREAALSGVSFKIEAGQLLAVVGPNGAGKSTLLELIAGAKTPQNGWVKVGDRDIRQFDPADYRSWHGYLPQQSHGLPLTVSELLRLRVPEASDRELSDALSRVGGAKWWTLLSADSELDGLNKRLSPWQEDHASLRARYVLNMASSILGNPPLILMDDPLGDRDPLLDPLLFQLLDELHGRATIILSTHRADLIQRADMIAVLNHGELAHFGPVGDPEDSEPDTQTSVIQPA